MPPSSLPFFVAHVLTKNRTSASPSLASGTKSPVTAFWPAGDPFEAVFIHARVAILRIFVSSWRFKKETTSHLNISCLWQKKVAQNACTNLMFVCINVKCHMYKLACSSINYLTLKHLAIWTTPAWCSFHCCSEGCRISSKMVEPPNRDTSSPPEHAQHKWPIRNKAPTKTPSTKNTPSGVNRMVQIWGSSKKNMFCSQCIGKNRDPYFSSISAMLIRVTKNLKCLHNKGIKMSSGSGDLCPTPDMHKRWSWTVHRPQKIRGRTCSQGAFIFCSLISSNDLNLHGTFFSQMTSTH